MTSTKQTKKDELTVTIWSDGRITVSNNMMDEGTFMTWAYAIRYIKARLVELIDGDPL